MIGKVFLKVAVFVSVLGFAAGSGAADRAIRVIGDLSHGSGKLGTYKALVIGINDYQDPTIPPLKTAVNDARGIAEVLEIRYGFRTELLLDRQAGQKAIYEALRSLAETSGEDDSVLIYYAGHGDLDRTYNDGWWIPSDARGGDPLTYLDNVQVQKAMRSMKARHVLLISDSCYSGTLFGESRAIPPVITEKYYLSLYNEKSRWGMTSGNKEPVSDRATGGHSIFAYQLIRELEKNDRPYISTQEIYSRIAPIVGNNSEQTPLCRPIRNTGDQGGEFVFVAGGSMVTDKEALDQAQGEGKGSLKVTARPAGAEVWVDGRQQGRSPVAVSGLSPGKLTVRAAKEGYETAQETVLIRAGRETEIKLLLDRIVTTGSIAIESVPSGAKWYLDGAYGGTTPDTMKGVEKGSYRVVVKQEGYAEHESTVSVRPGERATITARLEKLAAPAGRDFTEAVTGMEFVSVPGGCFKMGSPDSEQGRGGDEGPVHEVCVDGFAIGRYEVTVGEFRRFVEISGYQTEAEKGDGCYVVENGSWAKKQGKSWRDPNFSQGDKEPVVCVSWDDSQAYIEWLNRQSGKHYRLPTEAEWEYAARGGTNSARYWGDNPDQACGYANVADQAAKRKNSGWTIHNCDDGYVETSPVGSFKPNGFGLYDMLGNVWEWNQDWYGDKYYGNSPRNNPGGPSSGADRADRGGSWFFDPWDVRAADRGRYGPGLRSVYLGFRLVLPVQ